MFEKYTKKHYVTKVSTEVTQCSGNAVVKLKRIQFWYLNGYTF